MGRDPPPKDPSPRAEAAAAAFERDLEVARVQRASGFALRSSIALARLRVEDGDRDAARDLVALISEGFETRNLRAARMHLA